FLRTLQPIRTLETRVWKDWTAAHPEEAKALKPIGPARIAQADDEAGTVKQSTQQIAAQASNPSSGSAGAVPVGDAFAQKSKVEGASPQAAPQSSSTATPKTSKANAAIPPASEASAAATLRKSPLSGGALFVQVGAFTKEANAGKLAESLRQ